ncbi:hypothetical protein DEU56DRAFT_243096 [Suillus clintonianus]|uniref:uncharacterized protein n=1 Tax=Suillus clintonianus TaxID=1904413 RepID=UPI001B86F101|nr:uncharacterized protein DEU56DRAFT_243096 [Suillus clintonianus]KAG2143599.1 hypothetical protein DEU56DRAFT_243096 [Suillus clintonianus]
MGTNGLYVIRYRNMYFESHHYSDGYPEGLGLQVLQLIRQPNGIAIYRQEFGEMLDGLKSPSDCLLWIENGDEFESPSPKRPSSDWLWYYEIDLDRNIFHIEGFPFFTLECLPDDEVFIQSVTGCLPDDETYTTESVSADHYGHTACALQCPPEHKYKKPAPPTVDNSELATYQSLRCTGSQVALSDLLAISDILCQNEHARVSLLEIMVGQCMRNSDVGRELYEIELVNDHKQLTDIQWSIAFFMASITFVPQMFGDMMCVYHREPKRKEFTWVREDTVVCIATYLNDESCLQASVSRLINAISQQKDNPGFYFGIAFSVFHCVVVKVVKDAHTMTFSHTDALQFLPSFYTETPSTPGITALARLGHRIEPALFKRILEVSKHLWRLSILKTLPAPGADGSHDVPPNIIYPPLPLELWLEIARYLPRFDLITFGLISKLCREAALVLLRYPHVFGYRLVAVPKIPQYLRERHRSLHTARFSAVRADILYDVDIGMEWKNIPSKRIITPLEVGDPSHWLIVHFSLICG